MTILIIAAVFIIVALIGAAFYGIECAFRACQQERIPLLELAPAKSPNTNGNPT